LRAVGDRRREADRGSRQCALPVMARCLRSAAARSGDRRGFARLHQGAEGFDARRFHLKGSRGRQGARRRGDGRRFHPGGSLAAALQTRRTVMRSVQALSEISTALEPVGIFIRGVVRLGAGEGPKLESGGAARSIVLLGNIGGSIWPAFAHWRDENAGPDPLDTWSKAMIGPLARRLAATAYFPSDPPYQPFQRWALQAENLNPSPLGILLHPRYGLWHGYRGALGFSFEIVPPA